MIGNTGEFGYVPELKLDKLLSDAECAERIQQLSTPEAIAQAESDALEQIRAYEERFGMTSAEVRRQAQQREPDSHEVLHWLSLIESYPECLS